jgi:hypothetical protein
MKRWNNKDYFLNKYANRKLKKGDYVANFDPKVYLETYYCKIEGHMFVPTTLKSQHKIYSTGNWLFFIYAYYHRRS